MNALNQAQEQGFEVSFMYKSKQFIIPKLDYLYNSELLFALEVLSNSKETINYHYYLKRLEKDTLNDYQLLMHEMIKQNIGSKYNLDFVDENVKETYMGNLYWEEEDAYFYDNSVNMSTLAYKLIENKDSLDPRLPKIRSYFMEIKSNGRYLNTIDRSRMVSTILPGLVSDYGKDLTMPELELKGAVNEKINEYPYSNKIVQSEFELSVDKKGNGPIFINTSYENWEAFPERKDSSFSIETWFEYKGEKLDSIPVGEIIEMKIRVDAKKKGNYIMIQVPIPAGCSYGNNDHMQNRMETHREYHKEKTTIYVETMNMGEHIYTIQLQSRYKGVYTLNPAKVELMYMPVFNGNNELEKISIY